MAGDWAETPSVHVALLISKHIRCERCLEGALNSLNSIQLVIRVVFVCDPTLVLNFLCFQFVPLHVVGHVETYFARPRLFTLKVEDVNKGSVHVSTLR